MKGKCEKRKQPESIEREKLSNNMYEKEFIFFYEKAILFDIY